MSEKTVLSDKKNFLNRWCGMIFYFFLLFTFIGCNTLPIPQNPKDTLLVVPVNNHDWDKQHLRKMTITAFFDNWDEPLYISSAKDFVIKTDMPPGDYTITKIKATHPIREYDVNFSFTLYPGEITICPLTVDVTNVEYKEFDTYYTLSIAWNILKTDVATYNDVAGKISQMENVELWRITPLK